jgi:hypothetical protein
MTNTTIQIADDNRPVKPDISGDAGGIYDVRRLSRVAVPPPRRRSFSRHSTERRRSDQGDAEDGDFRPDQGHKKQVFKGTALLWYFASFPFLALGSLSFRAAADYALLGWPISQPA